MIKCWKCQSVQTALTSEKISFRTECEKCHSWLHCCVNCQNYKKGLPNDCMIPGTEYIADREAANFCEEFKLRSQPSSQAGNSQAAAKRLFGEDDSSTPPSFDSLFKD